MLSLTAHFKVRHDLLAGMGREFAFHPFPDRFACLSPVADFAAYLPKSAM
jgi:hypothetical protein